MITNIRFQYGMQRVGQDACNVLDNSEHICMTDVPPPLTLTLTLTCNSETNIHECHLAHSGVVPPCAVLVMRCATMYQIACSGVGPQSVLFELHIVYEINVCVFMTVVIML